MTTILMTHQSQSNTSKNAWEEGVMVQFPTKAILIPNSNYM
jgi:hypothetical protein